MRWPRGMSDNFNCLLKKITPVELIIMCTCKKKPKNKKLGCLSFWIFKKRRDWKMLERARERDLRSGRWPTLDWRPYEGFWSPTLRNVNWAGEKKGRSGEKKRATRPSPAAQLCVCYTIVFFSLSTSEGGFTAASTDVRRGREYNSRGGKKRGVTLTTNSSKMSFEKKFNCRCVR